MGWAATLMAALKAIPELVGLMGQLVDQFKNLQDLQTTKEINKIKEEVAAYTKQIEEAKDDEELKDLIAKLNKSISV